MRCTEGQTWDVIAFEQLGDCFAMDSLLDANSYYHADVVTFKDGDTLIIPDSVTVETVYIRSPWE